MIRGLIGTHLTHSYSKIIHEKIMNYEYRLIELNISEVDAYLSKKEFEALNVTIPYKQTVIPYLDEIDAQAKAIGAVNTIVNKNGKLYGYNTDYAGFMETIRYFNIDVCDKKVIVLGNGGASKAVIAVLKDLKAKEIILVKKNLSEETITYETCYRLHHDAQVIINTSPVGMSPHVHDCPIELSYFKLLESVVDVIYNPLNTPLLLAAKEKGCKTANGMVMLVAQAIRAIEHFNQINLDTMWIDRLYKQLTKDCCNIVLIGMPGCGKSTLGSLIAERLNRPCIEIDAMITEHINMPIREYILQYGEKAFRRIETEIVKNIASTTHSVISCGGGVIKNKENMSALKLNGKILFIDREPSLLSISIERPLSQNYQDIMNLYHERIDLYRYYADKIVKNNEDVEKAMINILKLIEEEE